ncbi:DUF1405 domain-containing protein [Halobacteriales archaeon SW_10_66_29]|nr:MAG: DUF1405 domain-containing protein [Halobacteriales archaeon SW_10_66_29]
MSSEGGVGRRIDAAVARYVDVSLPEPKGLPRWAAPLPEWVENVGLRLAWPVVAVNLAGTAFGFWYYSNQIAAAPLLAWPLIPVSPLATLYFALSLAAWRLDWRGPLVALLHVLAFFGCIKYGLWTVFVQAFVEDTGALSVGLWQFLIWSHVGMVAQAFVIHRYAEFPLWAVVVGTVWYAFNDVVDYFVPVLGGPHHTWINANFRNGELDRTLDSFDLMANSAVAITVLTTVLVFGTWYALHRHRSAGAPEHRRGS